MLKLHPFLWPSSVLYIPHILGIALNLKQLETIWEFKENLCFKSNQNFVVVVVFYLWGSFFMANGSEKKQTLLETPFWRKDTVVKGSI